MASPTSVANLRAQLNTLKYFAENLHCPICYSDWGVGGVLPVALHNEKDPAQRHYACHRCIKTFNRESRGINPGVRRYRCHLGNHCNKALMPFPKAAPLRLRNVHSRQKYDKKVRENDPYISDLHTNDDFHLEILKYAASDPSRNVNETIGLIDILGIDGIKADGRKLIYYIASNFKQSDQTTKLVKYIMVHLLSVEDINELLVKIDKINPKSFVKPMLMGYLATLRAHAVRLRRRAFDQRVP